MAKCELKSEVCLCRTPIIGDLHNDVFFTTFQLQNFTKMFLINYDIHWKYWHNIFILYLLCEILIQEVVTLLRFLRPLFVWRLLYGDLHVKGLIILFSQKKTLPAKCRGVIKFNVYRLFFANKANECNCFIIVTEAEKKFNRLHFFIICVP